ncbi:MAG TPA: MAPEG family protein [Caulobacteraceae bacterium]|nr:MAPEG family protein [Caulobacteraceae bacterium]
MTHTTELQMLFCAIALGLLQLLVSTAFNVAGRGLPYGVGPRDEPPKELGKTVSRLERAYRNLLETFPFFAGAVLLDHALGKSTPISVLGAQLYVWGRVLYVPAYVIAIPFTRTLCWTVSIVGILMVMAAVWPG